MSPRRAELSVAEARRVALAAQGFTDTPHDSVTMRTLVRTVGRTQVESVGWSGVRRTS